MKKLFTYVALPGPGVDSPVPHGRGDEMKCNNSKSKIIMKKILLCGGPGVEPGGLDAVCHLYKKTTHLFEK